MKLLILPNLFLFTAIFQPISCQKLDSRYLCTEQYCETYREENGCAPIDIACTIQNSTHNGRLFKSPTECNCCEICLVNLSRVLQIFNNLFH